MITINEIKEILRSGKSIFVDELKDPYYLRRYLYRCERINALHVFIQDQEHNYIIYAL